MTPHITDLFGEVPITHQEVAQWLITVPRIDPSGPRASQYIKAYDVVGKITRAKLAGRFEALTARYIPPQHWWSRFHWRY